MVRFIIRASFSQERMTYLPDEAWLIYPSKAQGRTLLPPLAESGDLAAIEGLNKKCD